MLILRPLNKKVIFHQGITHFLRIVLRVNAIAELLKDISQSACLCICKLKNIHVLARRRRRLI